MVAIENGSDRNLTLILVESKDARHESELSDQERPEIAAVLKTFQELAVGTCQCQGPGETFAACREEGQFGVATDDHGVAVVVQVAPEPLRWLEADGNEDLSCDSHRPLGWCIAAAERLLVASRSERHPACLLDVPLWHRNLKRESRCDAV
jgi:hypothetical protein